MSAMDIGRLYEEYMHKRHRGMPRRDQGLKCPASQKARGGDQDDELVLDCCTSSAEEDAPPAGTINAAAAGGNGLHNHHTTDHPTGSLVVMDPKDLKKVLKRAVMASMLDILSRHESRAYLRDRWLLKRLKKTLSKFELSMASLMAKRLASETKGAAAEGQRVPSLSEQPATAAATAGCSSGNNKCPPRQKPLPTSPPPPRTAGSWSSHCLLSVETCLPVDDSETACDTRLTGEHSRRSTAVAGFYPISAQSNCSNAASADEGRTARIKARKSHPTDAEHRRLPSLTSCSIASITESALDACVDDSKATSSVPFPRFPTNANCNHGTAQQQRRQQRRRQQQQGQEQGPSAQVPVKAARCIYGEDEPQQQQLRTRDAPPRVDIYAPGRPANTDVHRVKPGVCQCHAAATNVGNASGGGGGGGGAEGPRCGRCPSKPRPCPRRVRRRRAGVAKKKKKGGPRGGPTCQPGERSCGDCQPPHIALCPAKRGAENFSRVQLQTQPGKFITRQVLFFDGSHLYRPALPKGPCY